MPRIMYHLLIKTPVDCCVVHSSDDLREVLLRRDILNGDNPNVNWTLLGDDCHALVSCEGVTMTWDNMEDGEQAAYMMSRDDF